MAKERAKAGIQETCRCTWHNLCTCGAVRIAKEHHQRITQTTTLFYFLSTHKTRIREAQKIYGNFSKDLGMDTDKVEGGMAEV